MMKQEIKKELSRILYDIKKHKNSKTGFVISTTSKQTNKKIIFLPIRKTIYGVFGVATVYDLSIAKQIAKLVDGKIDFILVDAERKLENIQNLTKVISSITKKTKVLTFKNNDLTANSADALIVNLLNNDYTKKISIIGMGNIGTKLALKLVERGFEVFIASRNLDKTRKIAASLNLIKPKFCKSKIHPLNTNKVATHADLLVGFSSGNPTIDENIVQKMKNNSIIIDGGIGTINDNGIKKARMKKIKIFRLDIRPGFVSEVSLILETEDFLNYTMGKKNLKGIKIVAGGYYGNFGDVIVNNITKPTRVIGIADGHGDIVRDNLTKQMVMKLNRVKKILC